MSEKKIEV